MAYHGIQGFCLPIVDPGKLLIIYDSISRGGSHDRSHGWAGVDEEQQRQLAWPSAKLNCSIYAPPRKQ